MIFFFNFIDVCCMNKEQITEPRPRYLTLLCRPLMTKPSFECKVVRFEQRTATFEIRLDTVSSDSIASIRIIMSVCVRLFFL